jgi:peptidoglycan/LPS O-acetylase OafA/YrhL
MLKNIQALRGVAAILVVWAHLGGLGRVVPDIPVVPATSVGAFGVDLFFVISGFIMMYVTRNNWGHVGPFLLRRAVRIYPMWWGCLYFAVPTIKLVMLFLLGRDVPHLDYQLKVFFLWPALDPVRNELYPPLTVGWTLSYELLFYLVFGLIQLGRQTHVALKISIVLLSLVGASYLLPPGSVYQQFLGNSVYLEFALGVWLGHGFIQKKKWPFPLWPLLFLAFLDGPRWVSAGLPAMAVVCIALQFETRLTLPKWTQRLGDQSYSLYLTHGLVIFPIATAITVWLTGWTALTLVFLLTVMVGAMVYYLVERHLLNALRRFIK